MRPFLDNIERFGHCATPGMPAIMRAAGRCVAGALEDQRRRDDRPELLGLPRWAGAISWSSGQDRRRGEHGLHQQVPHTPRDRDRGNGQGAAPAGALGTVCAQCAASGARAARPATTPTSLKTKRSPRRVTQLFTSNRGLLEAQVRALRNVPTLARSLAISTEEVWSARRLRHRPRQGVWRHRRQ